MNPLWLLKIFGMVSGVNVKKALGYVIKYWREFLIATLIATVGYQNFAGVRFLFGAQTIPALESDLAKSEKNLQICAEGNVKLSMAIDKHNTRIDEYKKLSDELKVSIAELGGELAEARAETNTEVEGILKDPTPESCEKSMDYLRDGIKDLKW